MFVYIIKIFNSSISFVMSIIKVQIINVNNLYRQNFYFLLELLV